MLLAYICHVQLPGNTNKLDSPNSLASTEAPSHKSYKSDSQVISFMQVDAVISSFDTHGPYPWEIDDDVDNMLEEEDEVPAVTMLFSHENRLQMQQHALFLQAMPPTSNSQWVAVTFGLGLTDLERCDVDFDLGNLEQLP